MILRRRRKSAKVRYQTAFWKKMWKLLNGYRGEGENKGYVDNKMIRNSNSEKEMEKANKLTAISLVYNTKKYPIGSIWMIFHTLKIKLPGHQNFPIENRLKTVEHQNIKYIQSMEYYNLSPESLLRVRLKFQLECIWRMVYSQLNLEY